MNMVRFSSGIVALTKLEEERLTSSTLPLTITTFTYKCTVTRAYTEQTDIIFEASSGYLLASLGSYLRIMGHIPKTPSST